MPSLVISPFFIHKFQRDYRCVSCLGNRIKVFKVISLAHLSVMNNGEEEEEEALISEQVVSTMSWPDQVLVYSTLGWVDYGTKEKIYDLRVH